MTKSNDSHGIQRNQIRNHPRWRRLARHNTPRIHRASNLPHRRHHHWCGPRPPAAAAAPSVMAITDPPAPLYHTTATIFRTSDAQLLLPTPPRSTEPESCLSRHATPSPHRLPSPANFHFRIADQNELIPYTNNADGSNINYFSRKKSATLVYCAY